MNNIVHRTGAETIADIKTFTSSPIVPTPTADFQVATKQYVDSTKAPLNSPALTGEPTAPTAEVGTNTTQIATTAFVKSVVASSGGFTQSLDTNGWTKLPNGLIIQWFSATVASGLKTILFPIAFPNTCFQISTDGNVITSQTISKTGISGYHIASLYRYIAIGY